MRSVSDHLSPKAREAMIQTLESEGYQVRKPRVSMPRADILRELARPGEQVRLGVWSDVHTVSHEQQPTLWHDFVEHCQRKQVHALLDLGDTDDGPGQMHKGFQFQHFINALPRRLDYTASVYPRSWSDDVKIYRIDGNHDQAWGRESGIVYGELLSQRRPDITYLGYRVANVTVGPVSIRLMHGVRGGLSYARSYKVQKILEQMDPEERMGTDVLLIGHYHVADFMPGYQGVDAALVPCFQAQTQYLVDLGLQPVVGGLILDIEFGKHSREIVPRFKIYRRPLVDDFPK